MKAGLGKTFAAGFGGAALALVLAPAGLPATTRLRVVTGARPRLAPRQAR